MRRYTVSIPFPPPCRGMRMEEVITVSDLIAADCLVPVPEGKPCRPSHCHGFFMYEGRIFDCYAVEVDTGIKTRIPSDTDVQPIIFKKMKDTQ